MMRCECDCDCLATPNLHESVCDECQRGNHDWSRSGEPDAPHVGHRSHIIRAWYCDTCDSPYCELA